MSTFGERLKSARRSAGLSQAELAEKIGSGTQSVISAWELNVSTPGPEKLAVLCTALNISPVTLLGMEDELLPGNRNSSLSDDELALLQGYRSLDNTQRGFVRLVIRALVQGE